MMETRIEAPRAIALETPTRRKESERAPLFIGPASLLMAFFLFFASDREQALFSGIWVSSILSAALSLAEGTWMSEANRLAFGCIVGFATAAGVYIFLRSCGSKWDASKRGAGPAAHSPLPSHPTRMGSLQ